jgi:hypothetical protein
MANEFKHKDPGTALTQAEFIASDGTGHIFDGQAAGDVLYASSTTVLKNLAKATDGNVLELASGLPAWTASPTIGSTSWANANHAHAASNSGGTLTTVGVLDAGSITSNFGTINTGSSAISTTGVITAGGFTIGSAAILEAELEILDGATVTTVELNIIDGGTSATGTTIADADRVVLNDNGTMVQVAVTDLKTYIGGGPTEGTEANIEDEITGTYYAPLDLIKHSPGVAKFWVKFDGSDGTVLGDEYNVSGVSHDGAGDYTVTISPIFDSVNWIAMANARTAGAGRDVRVETMAAATIRVLVSATSAGEDATYVCVAGFGKN